jgi:hypothetical protein
VNDAIFWLLPLALAATFGWYLARGCMTGRMKTMYHGTPSATRAEDPKTFWLLAGFNLACMCGSIWLAFYLSR